MRNVVYLINLSLDGFIEGPDGRFDWSEPSEDLHQFFNDQIRDMGGFIYGRRMYETMAVWQTMDQDPALPAVMAEFARTWREKPKYVLSTTLETVGPNCRLIREDVAAAVAELKQGTGADLSVGGAGAARTLAEHDLIDEYRLVLRPVLVGGGKPGLPGLPDLVRLTLVESRTFACGTVYLRYRRA